MIVVAIDGTGPGWNLSTSPNEDYDQAMINSFCNQTIRQLKGQGIKAEYYRGPASFTVATVVRAWAGTLNVIKSGESKVILMGYSRGAACAIELAHYLKDMLIDVEAMFLFDPVKREGSLPNAGVIPRNVRNCYKIWRSLVHSHGIKASLLRYDSAVGDIDPYQRRWMGSCGNTLETTKTHLEVAVVEGSHGAAGGTPWYAYAPDRMATEIAASWMTVMLKRHQVPVKLLSDWRVRNKVEHASMFKTVDTLLY